MRDVARPVLVNLRVVHLQHAEVALNFLRHRGGLCARRTLILGEHAQLDLLLPLLYSLVREEQLIVDGGLEFRVLGCLSITRSFDDFSDEL